ncbi:MAG: hypothetical protein HDS68_01905 [Bacteroidales bacterium]|nr:hypothetical protein [Bacteroidales bacterium]
MAFAAALALPLGAYGADEIFYETFNSPQTFQENWTFPSEAVKYMPVADENGGGCVRISSEERGANAITHKLTGLDPRRLYRVKARFKCDSVAEGRGAVIYLRPENHGEQPWNASEFIYGTTPWQEVYMDFVPDQQGNATICCGLGFPWSTANGGKAKGSVLVDDVSVALTPLDNLYILDGKHIRLLLEADKVNVSPDAMKGWLAQLDDAYEAYTDLIGEVPFDGRKINILNTPGIEPGYWALAGNPILWNSHVAVARELQNFADNNDCCFGIMHEIGHTFSAHSIGHPDPWNWTDEIFANFRMSYALEKNGGKVSQRKHIYTGPEIKDYYKIFYDETIGAGKPELNGDAIHYTLLRIKDRYGWDVYKKAFRTLYALPAEEMAGLDTSYKKFRFFLDHVSAAAGEDVWETTYTPAERALLEQAFAR